MRFFFPEIRGPESSYPTYPGGGDVEDAERRMLHGCILHSYVMFH